MGMVIFMSMDGRFIEKLTEELNETLSGGRIQKIYQLTDTDFLWMVRTYAGTHKLFMSVSTSMPRIHITNFKYDTPDTPAGFCMLLRKHFESGIIKSIGTINRDRLIDITVETKNELGEIAHLHGIIEILGRYVNLILTDEHKTIIDAHKKISPFEGKKRPILRGIPYEPPASDKIDPHDQQSITLFFRENPDPTHKDILKNIKGFSPQLSRAFIKHMHANPGDPYHAFKSFINTKPDPVIAKIDGKRKFHYFDIFEDGEKTHFDTLSELLDEFYYKTGKEERLRQVSRTIVRFVNREYERNVNKKEKLYKDMREAMKNETLRMKGDLIIQHFPDINEGDRSITVHNYETGEEETIDLDPLKTPQENAAAYYKRYKKKKSAIRHIALQIKKTEQKIAYFEQLRAQMETASIHDMYEIGEELRAKGFMKKKKKKKQSRKNKPNFMTFVTEDGIDIIVGKNNLQNDTITHTIAHGKEWFFHTAKIHGAHVLVRHKGELDETTIRTAAQLAAWYSQARHSSSVPVDYTRIRDVKKVPGKLGSYVTYKNQKTIFIDPDEAFIRSLKQK